MNNAKLWLVVKPTVGIPLFLSAVAISSFLVHLSLVTQSGFLADYFKQDAAVVTTTEADAA